MKKFDIYGSVYSGVLVRIHGDFYGNELLEIALSAMNREIEVYFCPYCHRKFGTGHLPGCEYLVPEKILDYQSETW